MHGICNAETEAAAAAAAEAEAETDSSRSGTHWAGVGTRVARVHHQRHAVTAVRGAQSRAAGEPQSAASEAPALVLQVGPAGLHRHALNQGTSGGSVRLSNRRQSQSQCRAAHHNYGRRWTDTSSPLLKCFLPAASASQCVQLPVHASAAARLGRRGTTLRSALQLWDWATAN